jgi:hypothetical protein
MTNSSYQVHSLRRMPVLAACIAILCIFTATSCVGSNQEQTAASDDTLQLTSPAFAHQEPIPVQYTCDREDISPPLEWTIDAQQVAQFALIVDDPDAPIGTFVHWVIYNIPADARSLPPQAPPAPQLEDGSLHGQNSWNELGYGGPCPPRGTHHYHFKLYALNAPLKLPSGATKSELLKAMDGHIAAQALLIGTYARE